MITWITGTMFGGKSTEILKRVEEAAMWGKIRVCLKPTRDTRDGLFIKARGVEREQPAFPCDDERLEAIAILKPEIVFIDEVQFCNTNWLQRLISLCKEEHIDLVVSGLFTDFKQQLFPTSKVLMEEADRTVFFYSTCYECGSSLADRNVLLEEGRIVLKGETIQTGNHFNTICTDCFHKHVGVWF